MRIASFSDVHLGPCPRRDRFRHDERTMLEFSEHILGTHDQAVLVGDILHADWGTKLGPRTEEVAVVIERFSRLWQCWSNPFFTLLAGNHDRATREALGALDSVTLESDGVRVHYTHGDAFDPTVHGAGPNATMWLVGRLRLHGWARTSDWIEDVALHRANAWLNRGDPIARAADALAMRDGYDVVVAGHTHSRACSQLRHVVYANSGATVPGTLTYVSVDTAARTVELRLFHEDGSSGVSVIDRASLHAARASRNAANS